MKSFPRMLSMDVHTNVHVKTVLLLAAHAQKFIRRRLSVQ
jgi:hypothetical protein